jgi:hypothetical protein
MQWTWKLKKKSAKELTKLMKCFYHYCSHSMVAIIILPPLSNILIFSFFVFSIANFPRLSRERGSHFIFKHQVTISILFNSAALCKTVSPKRLFDMLNLVNAKFMFFINYKTASIWHTSHRIRVIWVHQLRRAMVSKKSLQLCQIHTRRKLMQLFTFHGNKLTTVRLKDKYYNPTDWSGSYLRVVGNIVLFC